MPDVLVRPVVTLDPDADVYRDAARDAFASVGVPDPVPIMIQALRSDLDGDGDGSDEAIVVADHGTSAQQASPGDASVVFLRRVTGTEVTTTVLEFSIRDDSLPQFRFRYRVAAIADLNGVGPMEVVVDRFEWEGFSADLYDHTGSRLVHSRFCYSP